MELARKNRTRFMRVVLIVTIAAAGPLGATPPAGDPNQPYDRLPGTWQTYHVKWAKPLAGGPLKVLFIVPYSNSREVVELAQRLDVRYTVIMNAGRSAWKKGRVGGGETSTVLHGKEADVLDRLAAERLALKNRYDAIVIGKVSWEVIPRNLRELVLKHVARGAGLVYVSPNRFKEGTDSFQEVDAADPQYTALFQTDKDPGVARSIFEALPFDLIPLKVLAAPDEFSKLKTNIPVYKAGGRIFAQMPVCITTSSHGKGRVLALNYFDNKLSRSDAADSLTPRVEYDKVTFDYLFALLGRCVRWSAGSDAPVVPRISFQGPATSLTAPVDEKLMQFCYEFKTPGRVFDRKDLPKSKILLSASAARGAEKELTFEYSIRDSSTNVVAGGKMAARAGSGTPAAAEVAIPMLRRGNYLVGLRVLNGKGEVLDFASRAFRVESALRVASVTTDRDHYARKDTINGEVRFSAPLSDEQRAEVRAVDTWNRTVFRKAIRLDSGRKSGKFSVPVAEPVSNLWDIYGVVCDSGGDIDAARTWVGIPQKDFDEYYWGLVFAPSPGPGWKGCMYADRIRPFGINGNFSQLIFGRFAQLEAVERHNLRNLMFTAHMGQMDNPKASRGPWDKEFSETCVAQVSRMLRYTADTGELPDSKRFPYICRMGWWNLDAGWMRSKMLEYKRAAKYGTPFHTLTGENYLSGEMPGVDSPNSCFCPLCTKNFQNWCRKEYKNDLKALNAEWGTDFTSWDQVRGILRKEAEQKDQRPRWVAFRHFMRSRVWTQLFIDWTDALRRFIPGAKTGRVGHDHFDFSRFRNHMTSSKIYNLQQYNDELEVMVPQELLQSFSNEKSWLIGASAMLRWMPDHRTPKRQFRLPWKMLFMGFRGFDWERCLTTGTLGGESPFTPDFSEAMPFFKNISDQVLYLQRGIGKLANTAKPLRSPVAILWSPWNDYISRLQRPGGTNVHARSKEKYPFSGSWLYNVSFDFGAIHDCLALLKSLRIRGTFVAPEDVINGDLEKRGFKALMLPYSKGMSVQEAKAIRKFVKNRPNVVRVGKGHAAYAHEQICGYLRRMEACDRAESDAVASLLERYAGITTPIELIGRDGKARRDTLMPVYVKGSAWYVGMMRLEHSDGKTTAPTIVRLRKKYHVWDVLKTKYLGYVKTTRINLDMYPKFFALLPAKPDAMALEATQRKVPQGRTIGIVGRISFAGGGDEDIASMGQVVHVRVYAPDGQEVECFRKNIVFDGARFEMPLAISYSEAPGTYTVKAEYPVTGMEAQSVFEVVQEQQQ